MKSTFTFFSLLCGTLFVFAQNPAKEQVRSTIDSFFEAFHRQDTSVLKSMVNGNIIMQSIGTNPAGEVVLSENKFNDFAQSIAGIPKDKSFEEKILGYSIQIDGEMANAWTPYEFWYDGKFSHCGVNSFQLMKEKDKWKIIYLVDSRRREGCQE